MLGGILKEARERQNLTIQDLEHETSIRRAYIAALEEENWDTLPSPVYVKGFIRNLSNFLNIDSIPLIEEYISILNGNSGAPKAEIPSEAETVKQEVKTADTETDLSGLRLKERKLRKKGKGNIVLTVFLIFALVGAGAFYFMSKNGNTGSDTPVSATNEEQSKNAEDNAKDKTVKETAKPKPTKVTEKVSVSNNAVAEVSESQQPSSDSSESQAKAPAGVEVSAAFNGDCWIKVVVDGNVVFEDIAESGSNLTWKGNESISVVAGNAGAMEITHNGKNLGAMGAYGQVAEKVFTK